MREVSPYLPTHLPISRTSLDEGGRDLPRVFKPPLEESAPSAEFRRMQRFTLDS